MSIAFQNVQFGAGRALVEASQVGVEIDKDERYHPDRFHLAIEVMEKRDELLYIYRKFLSEDQILEANKLVWGKGRTPIEYEEWFLTNVLMRAYRVFDRSHLKYSHMLKAIESHNPEWTERFVKDYNRKMRVCKVPIYIGSQ